MAKFYLVWRNLEYNFRDKILLNGKPRTPSKGSKSEKKESKKLPRVDEELHAKTIFEPVDVEARPAKTKPKIRSKLKWKEGLDPKEKVEESKGSDNDSGQMRLSIKTKKANNQEPAKVTTANKKSELSDTGGWEQPIFYIIIRKILEEILIWLIIIAILIFTRLRGQFRTR